MKFIKIVWKEHPIKEKEMRSLYTAYVIDKKGKMFKFDTYRNMYHVYYRYKETVISWEVKPLKNELWSMTHYSVHVNYIGDLPRRDANGKYVKERGKRTRLFLHIDNFTEVISEEDKAEVLNLLI